MKTDKTTMTEAPPGGFVDRHIGPRERDVHEMLATMGLTSLDELIDKAVPRKIRTDRPLALPPACSEAEVMADLHDLAQRNQVFRSFQGTGYAETFTPPVIQRNILENPGWYTAYTPYQPEIAQGRLEALLVFQTMVSDLTGLPLANASLLDEGTAAAEAMTLCRRAQPRNSEASMFFVAEDCHPQTIEVVRSRAHALGIQVQVGDPLTVAPGSEMFGALLQYPGTDGRIHDYRDYCARAHAAGVMVVVAADLLALTLLRAPGEFGAQVAVGNTQRFGVPLGYGGPHAAYMATEDRFKRHLPGRLVGVSRDVHGAPAVRLALQTREQHIRRDKATSNICTAQVLLAVMAAMYGVYHGPDGLRRMARRVQAHAVALAALLKEAGCVVAPGPWFDTLRVTPAARGTEEVMAAAVAASMNLRRFDNGDLGITLGEPVTPADVEALVTAFGGQVDGLDEERIGGLARVLQDELPAPHARTTDFMTHPVFFRYRSETEFMRYLARLQSRDLSLTTSMIPLGSCTMKLNAAAEMYPISERGFSSLHPFTPVDQAEGYKVLIERLGAWLADITGFAGTSFMPNAGAQGEYAGLQVIRAYHQARGDDQRRVCLIPRSAHGTNPASAIMSGMEVVAVACDEAGNFDLDDLRAKAAEHADRLAALMVTYPSTHGVFEESILDICKVVHEHGGQVYLDGANMNAMVGLCRPGELGADVCHLNLHKTFCIPHGGGGPGMGPICVASHLLPYLPRHPLVETGGGEGIDPVAAAPFGSAGILPISYAYIAMMGHAGLTRATQVAILNANYIARRLRDYYPVVYSGRNDMVAHECILDVRSWKGDAGIEPADIARRLMDYGFHAPTMSWPVAGTLMVEPTESESKEELDRFCEAMIAIHGEIAAIAEGRMPREDNPLRNAPHTARAIAAAQWKHPYSREEAAFPAPWLRRHKFWPAVGAIDHVYGDRHLVTTCPQGGDGEALGEGNS
ncbi:MAG: glycine dehydrogenase (aminomethyl-transferring) [Acidobacteria bacterium]|nr:MAG: glycine dehydrogenase (aminomethyl-transferring) [Acidobacteriota bacterium]